MATSPPSGDEPDAALPLRVNDNETIVFDHADGDLAFLAIVLSIVDSRQDRPVENQSGVEEVN
ncbi:hypothetical protein EJ105_11785 [Xanthobacter aminoxidans]|nr:hypothetical protein [Xanthobacter aminoxidans]MCL8382848.1 hypothetical protein [Xanthobacter aminoxidans]